MAAARGIRYLPVFRSRVAARLRIRAGRCELLADSTRATLILKFVATSAPQLALFNSLFSENAK